MRTTAFGHERKCDEIWSTLQPTDLVHVLWFCAHVLRVLRTYVCFSHIHGLSKENSPFAVFLGLQHISEKYQLPFLRGLPFPPVPTNTCSCPYYAHHHDAKTHTCARQCWIMGIAKDAVLPLPVSAQPRMSRPDSAMGMPCDWIGVGCWYLWCVMSAMMLSCKFCDQWLHKKQQYVSTSATGCQHACACTHACAGVSQRVYVCAHVCALGLHCYYDRSV